MRRDLDVDLLHDAKGGVRPEVGDSLGAVEIRLAPGDGHEACFVFEVEKGDIIAAVAASLPDGSVFVLPYRVIAKGVLVDGDDLWVGKE